MDSVRSAGCGSELEQLIPESGSSFTALLELPASRAVELLVDGDADGDASPSQPPPPYFRSPPPAPVFPLDTSLGERASKFSVFAALESIENNVSPPVKREPEDSYSPRTVSNPTVNQKSAPKRKEGDKKCKKSTKKGKVGASDASEEDGEKLPYVHVRARRGQATDSHSLAERARREKINARMKLLQELVPGCNKISGTAMVLDEIINHVQTLQRQVEYLSMRLAAVNSRVDYNFDVLLAAENLPGGPFTESSFPSMVVQPILPEGQIDGNRQQYQQPSVWGSEETSLLITPEQESFLFTHDSRANSVSLHSDQIKGEL